MTNLENADVRTYISEKKQPGQRHWEGKAEEHKAVYANRRRVKGTYGKRLLRKRGELIERSFAHCYDTGGMRRTHLRGRQNVLKRLLIHVGAFNLSLVVRTLLGSGTPRELSSRSISLIFVFLFSTTQGASAPADEPKCSFSTSNSARVEIVAISGTSLSTSKQVIVPRAVREISKGRDVSGPSLLLGPYYQ